MQLLMSVIQLSKKDEELLLQLPSPVIGPALSCHHHHYFSNNHSWTFSLYWIVHAVWRIKYAGLECCTHFHILGTGNSAQLSGR